jgi:hypothetical protein
MSFQFLKLHRGKTKSAFDFAFRTVGFVMSEIFAKDRGFAILTVRNLKFTFLKTKIKVNECVNGWVLDKEEETSRCFMRV